MKQFDDTLDCSQEKGTIPSSGYNCIRYGYSISSQFHFNRSYLGQKFRNHENMSFNEYLFTQRMERAKMLLEQTHLKVYEIANEVGYTEIGWFYKRFKSYTGISANEYRKMVAS